MSTISIGTRCPVVCWLVISGCAGGGGIGFVGRLDARITGAGAESAVPGKTAFVRTEAIKVKGKRIPAKEIDAYDPIESDKLVRLDVKQLAGGTSYDFNVIMGPPFGSPGVARGWIQNSAPMYRLDTAGCLYAWGYWPFFGDRWVSAAATGTAMALETEPTGKTRVYLLDKSLPTSEVTITCLADTSRKVVLTDVDTYVEISRCGLPATPWPPVVNPIPAAPGDPVRAFVDRIKDAALAADW